MFTICCKQNVLNITTANNETRKNSEQECIPVGYVPFAAVAVCWGEGCLHRVVSAQGGVRLGDVYLGGVCSLGGGEGCLADTHL